MSCCSSLVFPADILTFQDPKTSRNGILERPPSVATVQTLSLMAIYEGICSGENSIESTWALMGLACKLSQSVSFFSRYSQPQLTGVIDRLTFVNLLSRILIFSDNNSHRPRLRTLEANTSRGSKTKSAVLGAIYHRLLAGTHRFIVRATSLFGTGLSGSAVISVL